MSTPARPNDAAAAAGAATNHQHPMKKPKPNKNSNCRFWLSDLAWRRLGIWDWPAPPPGTRPRRKRPRRSPTGRLRVRPMYNRRPQLNPPADDLPF